MATVLLVDDENAIRSTVSGILDRQGHETTAVATLAAARSSLQSGPPPDVALVDLRLPDGEGTEILGWIRERGLPTAAVMISGHGTIPTAVDAVKQGAFDFLEKPLDRDRLLITVRNASIQASLKRASTEPQAGSGFLTESPAMESVIAEAAKLAPTEVPLLITGETGVGKEVLARWIHTRSLRRDGPFVALNCAALPESLAESELFGHTKGAFTGAEATRKGKFQTANGGTLFLDEIGDLALPVQAKLLRVLEENAVEPVGMDRPVPVNVRVVAASHRDLVEMQREGKFREDLRYRIAGFPLAIPPLRARPEDIPLLANHFFSLARSRQGWDPAAFPQDLMDRLLGYGWPGNVRELRWAVERAALLGGPGLPGKAHLPPTLMEKPESSTGSNIRERALQSAEIKATQEALQATGGRVPRAAALLGISRSRLYERLRELEITPADFRGGGKAR